MGLYLREITAMDKHCRKGEQKVVVEHINVESGGQATVGHVQTHPSSQTG